MEYTESKSLFKKYKFELTKETYEKFTDYEKLLVETNKVMNLTAITETHDIWVKHFLDSCMLCKICKIEINSSIIDVGCGAGFPSIPLAIIRPDLKITCLDSLQKRINFLENVKKELSLDNINCIHERAETGSKNVDLREKFDIATARAVAEMNKLSEFCIPYVKVGGRFIAMKGTSETCENAMNAIKILGGELKNTYNYKVEDNDRIIFEINKISNTPKKYPRPMKQIKNKTL